jgi:hypothetical protein
MTPTHRDPKLKNQNTGFFNTAPSSEVINMSVIYSALHVEFNAHLVDICLLNKAVWTGAPSKKFYGSK